MSHVIAGSLPADTTLLLGAAHQPRAIPSGQEWPQWGQGQGLQACVSLLTSNLISEGYYQDSTSGSLYHFVPSSLPSPKPQRYLSSPAQSLTQCSLLCRAGLEPTKALRSPAQLGSDTCVGFLRYNPVTKSGLGRGSWRTT